MLKNFWKFIIMPRNTTVVNAHFIRLTTWQASPHVSDILYFLNKNCLVF